MSIKRSFAGTSFIRPGVFSRSTVDQSGGAPIGSNGTLFIVGEANKGAPGDSSGIREFTSAQMSRLIEEFGSGPIVDVAKAALVPGSPAQGVAGPDRFKIWKSNSSVQASLVLENGSANDLFKLTDKNWGTDGNKITAQVADGAAPSTQKIITFRKSGTTEIMSENAAEIQLAIQYVGAGASAAMTIDGPVAAKNLVVTVTGGPGSEDLAIDLEDFTVQELVDFINNFGGGSVYTVTTASPVASVRPSNDLDPDSSVDVKTSSQNLYRLQEELLDIVAEESQLVDMEHNSTTSEEELPAVLAQTALTGGAKGASISSDFSDGFDASLTEDYSVCIPAISQDASDDILSGLTDASSTYDIESVQASLKDHLILRGNIKNRKEAQGMVGYRKTAKADVYAQARTLGSELMQIFMQDVLVVSVDASLNWKQPHVMAAVAAGIRLGTEVGEPLTYKIMNISGMGHAVNPETGISAGDFEPALDEELAIEAGVTFGEQLSNGGFRIVVDNTTYGADANFVFNRGSVVEAAHFAAQDIRTNTENSFIGQKISAGMALSIKSFITNRLDLLFADNIITASPGRGAPRGYNPETFTVTIDGNSATVQLEIIPVQGLDFVFIEFILGDISQSA